MEFFEFLSLPQMIVQQFGLLKAETVTELILLMREVLYISLGVAGGLALICLVFQGIGLQRMAKSVGAKHAWMGYIPFLNTYYAGKLGGETNFFGQKMKRAGLYAMLAELVYVGMNIFSLVINLILLKPEYYAEKVAEDGSKYVEFVVDQVPTQWRWMTDASYWCDILTYLLFIVMAVFFIITYLALFRKFYMRNAMIMTFLSAILPFRGFTVFAVRKNTPIDYNAYMKARAEEIARRQQEMYGGLGGRGHYGSYGAYPPPQQSPQQGTPQESPFDDFKEQNSEGQDTPAQGNPFEEFDNPKE